MQKDDAIGWSMMLKAQPHVFLTYLLDVGCELRKGLAIGQNCARWIAQEGDVPNTCQPQQDRDVLLEGCCAEVLVHIVCTLSDNEMTFTFAAQMTRFYDAFDPPCDVLVKFRPLNLIPTLN